MKKFLSMVMAAAMVVSLVPATAFAASDVKATAKVVDAENYTEKEISASKKVGGDAELQLTFTTDSKMLSTETIDFDLELSNAFFNEDSFGGVNQVYIKAEGENWVWNGTNFHSAKSNQNLADANNTPVTFRAVDWPFAAADETDETTVSVTGNFERGWVLCFGLDSTMDKVSKGKTATVTVDSDDITITNGDDLVYASVEAKGIKASVKDTVDVATEEYAEIKDLKIEPQVGSSFAAIFGDGADRNGKEIKLKLNSGFEFVVDRNATIEDSQGNVVYLHTADVEDDEIVIDMSANRTAPGYDLWTGQVDTYTISGLKVEATSAKAGSTATIKVYATGCDTVSVEVAKVVDYTVAMTVDEDEDVPVIYSGVDVDNKGITDDSDHESLEVTIKETFAGAWNNSKDFTLSVPEGVYIVAADPALGGDLRVDANKVANEDAWFAGAYNEGDYVDLTFERRTWLETNPDNTDDPAELTFTLTLVADPNFEGDVVLKLTGDAVDEQEVTIAKFVKPYTVEAQQNDMQIDYRNTVIPTSVVVKEAEAGLWDKDTTFVLTLDKIELDDEGKVTVDDKSGLELKDDEVKRAGDHGVSFEVSSRSDDEPAVVTISGLELYMDRSLPAGAYDLEMVSPEMNGPYLAEGILGAEQADTATTNYKNTISDINDDFVSYTAKAGFVNIVTAGREDTDSFTTKVVVPVGESYLISGETKQEIPVPAYINADGYTMLPLRAVAKALGINENNVLWDQASRTATVMYGSKIISMTYGQKVVYVNAAPIPASTSVEIKENRMFLGLRDLGNALGVTDITWDAATKTATLNGNK